MKAIPNHRILATLLGLFLTVSAHAHPGSPGHRHFPDELDEFDQVVVPEPAVDNGKEINLGGILVLAGIAGCLSFAFFQKQGGIWSDTTLNH